MTFAVVDLPEPLGPIRAWISTDSTSRLTPRRIVSPPSSATSACRLLISSTAMVVLGQPKQGCFPPSSFRIATNSISVFKNNILQAENTADTALSPEYRGGRPVLKERRK